MKQEPRISELHRRLEQLEGDLAGKSARAGGAAALSPGHRDHLAEITSQAAALRSKLDTASNSGWNAMKAEVEADWEALLDSFGRWVRHVDEDYR